MYRWVRDSLSEGLLALTVYPAGREALRDELLRGMRLCGLLERLGTKGASDEPKDAEAVRRYLAGSIVTLPADVFPLPLPKQDETPQPLPNGHPNVAHGAEVAGLVERRGAVRGAIGELREVFRSEPPPARSHAAGGDGDDRGDPPWGLSEETVGDLTEATRAIVRELAGPSAFANVPATVALLESEATALGTTTPNGNGGSTTVVPLGASFVDLSSFEESTSSRDGRPARVPADALVRAPGVIELKVVRQKIKRYEAGEVAHIENVLKGESNERVHRRKTATETILTVETERAEEREEDLQSTERFELQREATETSHEDAHVEGGVQVRASYGPAAEVTANAGFALNSSKDEATREAQNYARDVTQRSVARIQERVREQRTVRTLAEVEETIKHGVDNSKGNGHVVGIYRWVDKVYEAQVFNYGKRMLLEFNVPEPAAFFLNALKSRTPEGIAAEKPLPPMVSNDAQGNPLPKAWPLAPDDITIGNYLGWVQKYRVTGVTPPPKTYEVVTTTIEEGVTEEGKEDEKKAKKRKTVFKTAKDLKTPAGYKAIKYHLISLADNGAREHMLLAWTVGDRSDHHAGDASQNPPKHAPWGFGHADNLGTVLEPPGQPGKAAVEGTLPVALYYHDVWGFAVTLQVLCERTEEKLREWQLKTYEQIMLAYQELKSRYDEEIAAAAVRQGIGVAGRNPEANREIEKEELKKATISMLRGGRFEEFDAVYQEDPDGDDPVKKYPEIDVEQAQQEGRLIQFFEQAFEWPQITYVFYPYFWGRKKLWADRSQLDDPADPIFSQFLRAGAARVAVPVRRGYEDLVNAYLATDQVWGGGDAPAVGAPLYVSLAQEIRELTDAGAADAKPEGKSWEVSLPTTLVILNEEAKKLPVFEQ